MDYKELAEKAKEIDEKATPGPWMWDLRECNHQCLLTTTHSGKYYVMGFQRWGLQDALPSFQVYDRYDGPMKDRGSHGMVRADKLSKSYPGQEHHRGFDNFIDHPDARYIAESRQLFHLMAEAITDLLTRAEAAEARVRELETSFRTEKCENGPECVELGRARKRMEEAEVRAEKAERERDAAIKELDGVATAVDDLSDFIDEQIHPLVQYDMYTALRENADAISMWQYEAEWRGQKEE